MILVTSSEVSGLYHREYQRSNYLQQTLHIFNYAVIHKDNHFDDHIYSIPFLISGPFSMFSEKTVLAFSN